LTKRVQGVVYSCRDLVAVSYSDCSRRDEVVSGDVELGERSELTCRPAGSESADLGVSRQVVHLVLILAQHTEKANEVVS
jgi:hypothetical protein